MINELETALTPKQLSTLASIVYVGDAAYRDLMETQRPMFGHPYFLGTRGRIRTKLVQMQCEIESHDDDFPFEFHEREFLYRDRVPELRSKKVILHIARSSNPEKLPSKAKYKVLLSNNNAPLHRQMVMDTDLQPPYGIEPLYGLLVFGGGKKPFSVIQFPAPGYRGILETIIIPHIILSEDSNDTELFERKKAVLKEEFLAHGTGEAIS